MSAFLKLIPPEALYIFCGFLLCLIFLAILRVFGCREIREEIPNADSIAGLLELKFQFSELHTEFKKDSASGILRLEQKMREIQDLLKAGDEKVFYLTSLKEELEGRCHHLEKRLIELEKMRIGKMNFSAEIESAAVNPRIQEIPVPSLPVYDRRAVPRVNFVVSDHEPLG